MKKLALSTLVLAASFAWAQTPTSSNSIQGCLSGSDGNYMLMDQSGKDLKLSGTTVDLKAHLGHKIEISGAQLSDSYRVDSVKMISETCDKSLSSAPAAAPAEITGTTVDTTAAPSATLTPADKSTAGMSNPVPDNSASAPVNTTIADSSAASSSSTPASTTPEVQVKNDNFYSSQNQASSTQGTQPAAITPDPNAAVTTTTTTTTSSNLDSPAPAATPAPVVENKAVVADQPVASTTASSDVNKAQDTTLAPVAPVELADNNAVVADPSNDVCSDSNAVVADQKTDVATETQGELPQTASPLPLLGLLGFGSMAAGLLARRKK